MTLELVAVGDSTVDILIPVPRFPTANEDSVHSSGMERHMGGSSNYLIMASRLGLRVGVADAVGDDDLGAYYVAGLEAECVDTTHIMTRQGERTRAVSSYSPTRGSTPTSDSKARQGHSRQPS